MNIKLWLTYASVVYILKEEIKKILEIDIFFIITYKNK